jgi:tRNA(Ile)-lysidine synthase TilS/MesJ
MSSAAEYLGALREPPSYFARMAQAVARNLAPLAQRTPGAPFVIGLSGGKDSLCLTLACAKARGAAKGARMIAACVDAEEFPLPMASIEALRAFCRSIDVEFETIRVSAADPRSGETGCWRCARSRRQALLERARSLSAAALLLGHHLDDAATTALMNLCGAGCLSTLPRVADFMGIPIARPMLDLSEGSLRRAAQGLGLPVIASPCPRSCNTARAKYAPALAILETLDTLVKRRLVDAAWRLDDARDAAATRRRGAG